MSHEKDIRDVLDRYDQDITVGNMLLAIENCDFDTLFIIRPDGGDQSTNLYYGTIENFCKFPCDVVDFFSKMIVSGLTVRLLKDKNDKQVLCYILLIDLSDETHDETEDEKDSKKIITNIASRASNDHLTELSVNKIIKDYNVDENQARYILELMNMMGLIIVNGDKETLEVSVDYEFEINGFMVQHFGKIPHEYIDCKYCIFHSEEYCEQYSYDKNNTTVCKEFIVNYKSVTNDIYKEKKEISNDDIIKDFIKKAVEKEYKFISIKSLMDEYTIDNDRAAMIVDLLMDQKLIEDGPRGMFRDYHEYSLIINRLEIYGNIPDGCNNCNYCIYAFKPKCNKSFVSPPTTICSSCDIFVPDYKKIEKYNKDWEIKHDRRTLKDLIKQFIENLDEVNSLTVVSSHYLAESLVISIERAESMIYAMMLQGLIEKDINKWTEGNEFITYEILYNRIKLFKETDLEDACIQCVYYNTDKCHETYIDPPPIDHKTCHKFLMDYEKIENGSQSNEERDEKETSSDISEEEKTIPVNDIKADEIGNVFDKVPSHLRNALIDLLQLCNRLLIVEGTEDYKNRKNRGTEPDGVMIDNYLYIKSVKVGEAIPTKGIRINLMKYLHENEILLPGSKKNCFTCQLKSLTYQTFYKFDVKKLETKLNVIMKFLDDPKEILQQEAKSISYNMMKNTDEEIIKQFVIWVMDYNIDKVSVSHMKRTFGLNKSRSNALLKRMTGMNLLAAPKKGSTGPRIVKRDKCAVQYMIYIGFDKKCGFCEYCGSGLGNQSVYCSKNRHYVKKDDNACEEFKRNMFKIEKHCKIVLDDMNNE